MPYQTQIPNQPNLSIPASIFFVSFTKNLMPFKGLMTGLLQVIKISKIFNEHTYSSIIRKYWVMMMKKKKKKKSSNNCFRLTKQLSQLPQTVFILVQPSRHLSNCNCIPHEQALINSYCERSYHLEHRTHNILKSSYTKIFSFKSHLLVILHFNLPTF